MLRHLFSQIEKLFRPNDATYTERKEPILFKKLGQGSGAWSTQKTLLRWNLDTVAQLLCLSPNWKAKVQAALGGIPKMSHTASLRKCSKLLGLLQSIAPAVAIL